MNYEELARQSGATEHDGSRSIGTFCFTKAELREFALKIVRECSFAVHHEATQYRPKEVSLESDLVRIESLDRVFVSLKGLIQ